MKRFLICMFVTGILSGCVTSEPISTVPREQVQILRDEYGTPHIYADKVYDLFYGYGYAVSQDRLFQMEMAKRSTQGAVAEVLGAQYLNFDINARRLYSPASIERQLTSIDKKDMDIFEGYAAGMNAWIAEVERQPVKYMPKQFIDFDFLPSQWSSFDVAMIFVGTMANRFGDFNSETENLAILAELTEKFGSEKANAIFDDLNPQYTRGTATSISKQDWQPPTEVFSQIRKNPTSLSHFALEASQNSSPISGFSNCYVIGKNKVKGANSILVNGPQFGWYDPAYTYSVGLHGAGFNIVGNTPFAYPAILFGHNENIGWGATWGAGDIVDLFMLDLDKKDPEKYRYNEELIALEKRLEVIKVKDADDHEQVIYRSVHGQVIAYDERNLVAISKKRTWDGSEIKSLLAWLYQATAENYDQWITYADDQALNINWYYSDRDGNIAYSYTGHYPLREKGHDNRIPVTGDGSMDWLGIQDFSHNPSALNPEADFIANWNNKPAPGVLNPDLYWYSWSGADRVDALNDELAGQALFTPQEAWDLVQKSSYVDLFAKFILPIIDDASLASAEKEIQDLNTWLQSWDRNSTDKDNDGYYDQPQYLFMQTFAENIIEATLGDDLGETFKYFQSSGYPKKGQPTASGMNLSSGLKATYEALLGKTKIDYLNGEALSSFIQRVLKRTFSELQEQYGSEYTKWQLVRYPRLFDHRNFMNIPQNYASQTPTLPLEQNRGTENNMTVFYSDRIEAFEVVPPGQSGFIAPDGTLSNHMYDQLELYQNFDRKRMWFYKEDVLRQAKSKTLLEARRAHLQ